jgi:hypothetical protein
LTHSKSEESVDFNKAGLRLGKNQRFCLILAQQCCERRARLRLFWHQGAASQATQALC